MFFFCNTLLLFLSLNSRSSVADKEQAAGDGRRSVDGEKEMGLLRVQQVSRRLVLQETRDHELEMCSFALEEAHNDELEGMKDDECEHEQEQEQGHRVDTRGIEQEVRGVHKKNERGYQSSNPNTTMLLASTKSTSFHHIKVFKMHMLRRCFHTLKKNVSFSSPTDTSIGTSITENAESRKGVDCEISHRLGRRSKHSKTTRGSLERETISIMITSLKLSILVSGMSMSMNAEDSTAGTKNNWVHRSTI